MKHIILSLFPQFALQPTQVYLSIFEELLVGELVEYHWVMRFYIFSYFPISWQPTEQNTYADIEAVYRCLGEKYGVKEEDVILYGQSVGSGPTLDLATRLPKLRAVVLHSPILSGLRVMYPVKRTYWFDIYKNIDKIPFVKLFCPGNPCEYFFDLFVIIYTLVVVGYL